jgi:hypothetical protein
MLFLLRTEVIGLNAWLALIYILDILLRCLCGWLSQTVQHILLFCPQYSQQRLALLSQAGTDDLTRLLSCVKSAQLTARWLVDRGALPQFNLAKEIEQEDIQGYQAV